jgi:acyl-CoA thioester hydrolase
MKKENLVCRTEIEIRFSEVDSMGVVWHGNYIKYFEDGREAFGNYYGINYMHFHSMGIMIPLVKINCDFKKPLRYGDKAVVETRFVNCESAKLQYDYTIYHKGSDQIVATGSSVQVFLNTEMELLLEFPPFFREWKKKHALLQE